MYKEDTAGLGAGAGFARQAGSGGAERRDGRVEIVHFEGEMVDAAAALLAPLGDRARGVGGFENLDCALGEGHERDGDPLGRDLFPLGDRESQGREHREESRGRLRDERRVAEGDGGAR